LTGKRATWGKCKLQKEKKGKDRGNSEGIARKKKNGGHSHRTKNRKKAKGAIEVKETGNTSKNKNGRGKKTIERNPRKVMNQKKKKQRRETCRMQGTHTRTVKNGRPKGTNCCDERRV